MLNQKDNLQMKKGIPLREFAAEILKKNEFTVNDNSLLFKDDKQAHEAVQLLKHESIFEQSSAAELFGMSLIVQAYRKIIKTYLEQLETGWTNELLVYLEKTIDTKDLQKLHESLQQEFKVSEENFLIEAVVIWLCNANPAFQQFNHLFSDESLRRYSFYESVLDETENYFDTKPSVADNFNLLEVLKLAADKHPNSIFDQLSFLRTQFSNLLGDLLWSILLGIDILQEVQTFRGGGPGPLQDFDFSSDQEENERFSEDRSWMASLVLMSKSTYVWLAQLSRRYKREIRKLDEIPEEELQSLAESGFNGLWLIGIWERSFASRSFKQLKGNHEAIASAYSLKNYHVAPELGGDEAMRHLQHKAWKYGIRIGCDMVPNHMGIDSDWVVQHPDWFMQVDEPPFPGYQFHSQNLTNRDEIEVFVEDHYYDEADAAVVFKLYDRRDGRVRYIYHGNDGTSIPWNDTAQLNYLLPEVREAVIQEIVNIARYYPVIRFDAAMTLAKKHIRRLWFPPRGSGGDIPSRARFAMTDQQFNLHLPDEFWREVVDRVAQEAPDTLLLAEAFWMMEGFFVRTLGMHRVYNSAFMNMLKAEENAKYRSSIKNVLDFNPQILKRFVNFMSNPDEDTAIAQFGTDDKYFGVCVMMATMPGLPMFAHGQLVGFTERYGMEYSRPRHWENVNSQLLQRHEKEIFPLLKNRYLFAEVDNFILYDFHTNEGYLNENVFAYSNEANHQRTLVVFHNAFQETAGYVHAAQKPEMHDGKVKWISTSLAKAWQVRNSEKFYTIFTDAVTDLTYVRRSSDLYSKGLHIMLGAFKYSVFWQVQEVEDIDGTIKKLYQHLQMSGTSNLAREMKRLEYGEMLDALKKLLAPEMMHHIILNWKKSPEKFMQNFQDELAFRFEQNIVAFLNAIDQKPTKSILSKITTNLKVILKIPAQKVEKAEMTALIMSSILNPFAKDLEKRFGEDWFTESQIKNEIYDIARNLLEDQILEVSLLTGVLIELMSAMEKVSPDHIWLKKLLAGKNVQEFLQVHEFDKILWFNCEAFEQLQKWLDLLIPIVKRNKKNRDKWIRFTELLKEAKLASKFHLDKISDFVKREGLNEK